MNLAGCQFTPRQEEPLVSNYVDQEPPLQREAAMAYILRSTLPHITNYQGRPDVQLDAATTAYEAVAKRFEAGEKLSTLLLEYEVATQSQPTGLSEEQFASVAATIERARARSNPQMIIAEPDAAPKRPPVLMSQPGPHGVPMLMAVPDTMPASA